MYASCPGLFSRGVIRVRWMAMAMPVHEKDTGQPLTIQSVCYHTLIKKEAYDTGQTALIKKKIKFS